MRKVEAAEFGIDRHRHDMAGEDHVLRCQPGAFRAEQDGGAAGLAVDRLGHFLGTDHRRHDVAFADGRGEDLAAIGDGVGHRVIELGPFEHEVGTARRRAGIGIGPTVARGDDAHFGQAEIEHRPCRLADVLAKLRADEDDNRRRCDAAHSNLPGSGGSPTSSAISAKSLASEKSR